MLILSSQIAGSLKKHSLESHFLSRVIGVCGGRQWLAVLLEPQLERQEHPSASLPYTTTDLVAFVHSDFMFQGHGF